MKKNHFWQSALFASALLFGFTACSSDDNGAPQQNTNQERTLTIALNMSNSTTMRAITSEAGTTDEQALHKVLVAIFNGDNQVVKIEEVDENNTDNAENTSIAKWANSGKTITLAAQGLAAGYTVYVVANAHSDVSTALLAVANKSDFEAVTSTMAQTLNNGTVAAKGLLMLGKSTIAAAGSGLGYDFTSSVDLYRMVAKVSLESITFDLQGIYASAALTITDAYLDNVPSEQKIKFAENTSATSYTDGITGPTTYLVNTYATAFDGTTPTDAACSFYTMPNAETEVAKATRLVLKGTFNGTDIYYPIYLNYTWDGTNKVWQAAATDALTFPDWTSARAAKKVYPNDWYKITATIKTIGVTDPTQDLDPQAVQVTITVKNWVGIAQNATFE